MTAEEYIKSRRIESYPGGQLCYSVSEKDALKAIEMARSERKTDLSAENDKNAKIAQINNRILGKGSDSVKQEQSSEDSPIYREGFKAGYRQHINDIWHDCNDRSISMDNSEEVVLLLENGMVLDYEADWEDYFSLALKWAYKKDLLPKK